MKIQDLAGHDLLAIFSSESRFYMGSSGDLGMTKPNLAQISPHYCKLLRYLIGTASMLSRGRRSTVELTRVRSQLTWKYYGDGAKPILPNRGALWLLEAGMLLFFMSNGCKLGEQLECPFTVILHKRAVFTLFRLRCCYE
ncbi:unnamed protein product [Protopolystoma xenopodis]|uniref:Uncharacterized protein n=1 Tax=Protopolystoma xenopodis TaxID=117903 RepID=A0A3S5A188_9PLAT|nr:unnamed protein product [Protopolystoma xenopodis]